jgi:pantoate kinase
VVRPGRGNSVSIVVNDDPAYDARTTRRAVGMLFDSVDSPVGDIRLEQEVQTPIGSGFGASAASSVSAVYAAAGVLGIHRPKKELALFAHDAEIIEQTGLGTVSVVYGAVGAGAITRPGSPGNARFITVKAPSDIRIVTAHVAPYDKKDALSSTKLSRRINVLGEGALRAFLADPSIETLAAGGESFSRNLGLENSEMKKLIQVAKRAGAKYASQNMIGYAIHSLVDLDRSRRVAGALSSLVGVKRVDVFEVGRKRASAELIRR